MSSHNLLLLLSALALLAACAAGPGPSPSGPRVDPPCHLVPPCAEDVCLSYVSMGAESYEEAEASAIAGVSRQVASQVRERLRQVTVELEGEGYHHFADEFRREFDLLSTFDRAELIHIGERNRCPSGYEAVAYLLRAPAAEALELEYVLTARPFRRTVEVALGADRITDFSASFCETRSRIGELLALGAALRAIRGSPGLEHVQDQAAWLEVLDRASRFRTLPVGLQVTGDLPEGEGQKLASALGGALSQLGVRVRTGDDCEGGIRLETVATFSCDGGGSIGPRCSLSLAGEVGPCGEETVWRDVELIEPPLSGHSTWSEREAEEDLLRQLTRDALEVRLRKQLRCVLPID